VTRLETPRLILRPWQEGDRAAFVTMNSDTRTTRFFPAPFTASESSALLDRLLDWQRKGELCFSLAERRQDRAFVVMVGLSEMENCGIGLDGEVEVGWRLNPDFYGQGYATEAAQGWIAHGFAALGLGRILAWTAAPNRPSQAVMARLGMQRAPELDRDHPRIAAGDPLRRHLVWRIEA